MLYPTVPDSALEALDNMRKSHRLIDALLVVNPVTK